jgi:hypothetical protein
MAADWLTKKRSQSDHREAESLFSQGKEDM